MFNSVILTEFTRLDLDGALEHFYRGAADARHQLLAALRYFYFDVAGSAHFFALQNVQGVCSGKPAMFDKISAQGSRSGASSSIFVEVPGKHAARKGFAIVAASEAVGHGAIFSEQFTQRDHIHHDFGKRITVAKLDHQIENSGGDVFGIELGIKIFDP